MNTKSTITKIFATCLLVLFFCLAAFSVASPGTGEMDLRFDGRNMSAEIQGAPLRDILEKLKKEKGIWFKCDASLLEETVSIKFEDLPLQKGLRRIFSNVSHCLVFDQDEEVRGVFILDKNTRGGSLFKIPTKAHPRKEATKKSTGSRIGNKLLLPKNTETEMSAEASRNPFPSTKGPSASKNALPSKNPFTEKSDLPSKNPFSGKTFPFSKSPKNQFPPSSGSSPLPEDSPANPFGESQ